MGEMVGEVRWGGDKEGRGGAVGLDWMGKSTYWNTHRSNAQSLFSDWMEQSTYWNTHKSNAQSF